MPKRLVVVRFSTCVQVRREASLYTETPLNHILIALRFDGEYVAFALSNFQHYLLLCPWRDEVKHLQEDIAHTIVRIVSVDHPHLAINVVNGEYEQVKLVSDQRFPITNNGYAIHPTIGYRLILPELVVPSGFDDYQLRLAEESDISTLGLMLSQFYQDTEQLNLVRARANNLR